MWDESRGLGTRGWRWRLRVGVFGNFRGRAGDKAEAGGSGPEGRRFKNFSLRWPASCE